MEKSAKYLLAVTATLVVLAYNISKPPDDNYHLIHSTSLVDKDTTICVIGDSGSGDNNAIAVAHALETMDCSQLRILGDIVYPAGIQTPDDVLLKQKLLAPFQYFIDRNIPIYLVLGNHDHKQNGAAWLKVAEQHPALKFPNFYYSEDWGAICFFNLDTSFYQKIYFAQKRYTQTLWLRNAMSAATNSCEFSIATGHHPYRSSGSHGNASWQLNLLFEEELIGKVDLYLSGHDHHLSDEGTVKATRLLISGAAGAHKYKLKQPSENLRFAVSKYGFLTLRFSRNKQNELVADYRFYTLLPDGKGGYTKLTEEWQGQIVGQGVRSQ